MLLRTLPLVFVLAGLALYAMFGGADFGAGACRLVAGRGEMGRRIRDHAQHSMGPVWEANHVWLIFVLTVTWTAYPRFFGSVASTLAVPLFLAGLGIVLRGASYALRSAADSDQETRTIDTLFGVVSLLTPFMLGTCVGALATGRVPVGNAAGGQWSSWTGPISILIGVLSVAFCLYLAAAFLAADAGRRGEPDLVEAMRQRALGSGVVAGVLAIAGLAVLHSDARALYHGMVHGGGLVALLISAVTGTATLVLIAVRKFEWARYGAGAAVAAVVSGWVIARWPTLLPGLTIQQAAAGHDTLVAVVVVVLAGGALLFPSLGLLFTLAVRGQLDSHGSAPPVGDRAALPVLLAPVLGARVSVALLIVGAGLLIGADASWAHLIGVLSLFGFVLVGFAAVVSQLLADD